MHHGNSLCLIVSVSLRVHSLLHTHTHTLSLSLSLSHTHVQRFVSSVSAKPPYWFFKEG
jgi:hypothetical protein